MRVLHVSAYFPPARPYGGPPASVLGLCHALQRNGVEVEVVTTTANGPQSLPPSPPGGETYEGVRVHYAARSFPRRFFGAKVREPLMAALARADVCHIHGVWNVPVWWAGHLARRAGVPYLISPRGMLQAGAMARGRWRKAAAFVLFDRRNLRGASLLHATSDDEVAALRALDIGVPIAMVPNGVDVQQGNVASGGSRARFDIPADAFVVMFLGRFHRIKRLELLADAFASLRATHPAAHLVLAGPDEHGLAADIRRRLAAHAPFVHIADAVHGAEKWAMLRDADVSVQCSNSESFGLAVVESLAVGVPVIVTKTCPWPEIETQGCGLWVEQTVPAIAEALRELAGAPAHRAQMGERAMAFARERYAWDAIAPQMAKLYADIA